MGQLILSSIEGMDQSWEYRKTKIQSVMPNTSLDYGGLLNEKERKKERGK